jgi:NADPH2:quinone reductase
LGADVIINYETDDFAEVVMAETGNAGVDVVFDNVGEAVMERSMNCLAYNGRYLMMGFASNKEVADEPFVVPRRVLMGNVKLCGVVLNYAGEEMAGAIKQAMGWNIAPTELGERITAEVLELVRRGDVRPVIGRTVAFEELPAAVEAMAHRDTTGRTIVLV